MLKGDAVPRSCQFPRAATSWFCTRSQEPGARSQPCKCGWETGGPADCFRNRIHPPPCTRDASGAVKLSSNRQGSGIRGSEWEPLKPPETHRPGKSGHITGDGSKLAREDPVKDPNPRGHRPSPDWHRRSLWKKSTRQAPDGPREGHSSQVMHADFNSGRQVHPKNLHTRFFILFKPPTPLTQHYSFSDNLRVTTALR